MTRKKGVIVAAPWIERLNEELRHARTSLDAEGVHQVRVAVARLRVFLALGENHALTDDLRWLRRGLAAIRDADVLLAQDPPRSWARVLERRRTEARRDLGVLLESDRLRSLLLALSQLRPLARERAEAVLSRWAARTLRRGNMRARAWSHFARVHALRRAARRLRFALEWLDRDARPLAKLQDAIGVACDRQVALRALPTAPAADRAVAAYRRALEREVPHDIERARKAWRKAKPFVAEL